MESYKTSALSKKLFKYSIFDLDGTLLNSMYAWHDLGKDYLLKKGINPPDNLNQIIVSMSMLETAIYFKEAFNIKSNPEVIIEEIKKLIADKYKYDFNLKPYVKEYLQKLKDENTIMCIVTSTPLDMARDALERNRVIKYFSFVLSCDEVGVGKNKPDVFNLAANKLDAKPAEIAVYEDADFALITAREAGFYTIGVYDEYFKDKRKDIEAISNIYIESFKEIM
jgi:HAD superfamily hydrolase (TIGR01509 family)